MADQVGVRFMPGAEQGRDDERYRTRSPEQEALRLLSLLMPDVFGARAPAPAWLLTSPGGMGQPAAKGNVTAQALAGLAGLPPRVTL